MAPLLCGALNLAAALVLVTALAPGTPLVADAAERERYVQGHVVLWRAGWSLWTAAALALVWFYAWWRARVRGPRAAPAIAAFGFVVDASAEMLLIVRGPDAYAEVAPLAFFLTGAIANGLYTVAGALLTVATALRTPERAWAWTMWGAGALLTLGAVAALPVVTAAATAVLFALFVPWCAYLAWRLG